MHEITVAPGESIAAAIRSLPSEGEALVRLLPGEYREKLELERPRTRITGASPELTRIVWDDCANAIHPADGLEYNTFRTATLRVTADGAALENLCVENSRADPEKNGQCVALYVYGDGFLARGCRFASTQDTLFCGPLPDDLVVRYQDFLPDAARYREGDLRQRFENCEILGSVDFIFGCADAVFHKCRVVSVFDGRDTGFVCAPAHSLKQKNGFLFADCDFSDGGVSAGSVFLARPWRDFGKASFVGCRLDRHISPALFDRWNDTERFRTARFEFCGFSGAETFPVAWSKALSRAEAQKLLSRV